MEAKSFSQMRLGSFSELEPWIKKDPNKYLSFATKLNDKIDSLPIGGRLSAVGFVSPDSYELFVKLCCLRAWVDNHMKNELKRKSLVVMLPDYSGVIKIAK